jgi:hypothetical protein
MTTRADIFPNANGWRRLSYTCRAGWIDWGHAMPGRSADVTSTAGLVRQVMGERCNWPGMDGLDIRYMGQPAFVIAYGQAMGGSVAGISVGVSTVRHYVIRKGLSVADRERVALGIFMEVSLGFEAMQAGFPYSMVTDSGFSVEDLPSNLVGFYGTLRSVPQAQLRELCGETSPEVSAKVWDESTPDGLGTFKNGSFRPRIFHCLECGEDTDFPAEIARLRAARQGPLYRAPAGRFLDGRLVNARVPMTMDERGLVRPR